MGVDETTIGIGDGNLIIVAAETRNPVLAKDYGYKAFRKGRDFLHEAADGHTGGEVLPSFEEMQANGLETFHWTRARAGRFRKPLVEHASIAQVVAVNGYRPQSTVLLIDAFHAKFEESRYLIKEYLWGSGFRIPEKNIELHISGDRSIPIINYADILAMQIGLTLNERYRPYSPGRRRFLLEPYAIPFDERRVSIPLGEEGRQVLDTLLDNWRQYKRSRNEWNPA